MQELIPDKRPVTRLVEQAYEGRLCLPNFQRNFIWRRDEVADLVRSILRGYYIGSLLLLRCDADRPPFGPTGLQGARPSHNPPRPELLVLDGQQRLTALIYALTAPDLRLKDSSQRRWYFVDLSLLLKYPDDDEIVFDRAKRELDGLDQPEVQYARRILPCTVLLKNERYMKWRDGLDDWLRDNDPEGHREFRDCRRDAWTTAVTNFQSFDVPLVELPRVDDDNPASIGRVCAIFEKLNSTGVELSVYDLLNARLYPHCIKLHELWKRSCHEHHRLHRWSKGKPENHKFGVLVLRTLALLRGLDPKPRMLINLVPQGFEEDWARAAAAIERTLELIEHVGEDGFGVFDKKWLPGFGLIPALAAMREEIESLRLGSQPRADLRRWYWCNVFLERFSSGVESKSRKDYAELLAHWTKNGPEPAVFKEAQARIAADGYSIGESASYASAVYSGVFCLLAIRGARDWRRGEHIQLQELNDHHVFPRAYLKEKGLTKKSAVNSVANRTLISGETNKKIKDKAPAEYVDSRDVFPEGPSEELLKPHFLGSFTLDALRRASGASTSEEVVEAYSAFCHYREKAIIAEIRRVCGIEDGQLG